MMDNQKKATLLAFLLTFTNYAFAGDASMNQTENNASVMQSDRYENTPMSVEERSFLYAINQMVASDDQQTDYQKLIANAPTDHKGIFWYECAVALSELPESGEMDLRDNGRLFVALGVLSNMLKGNSSFPQILAQRMIVLNYLAHGYSAVANNQFIESSIRSEFAEKGRTMAKILIDSSFEATKRFPNDDWFKSTHAVANQDFGYLFESRK
jgi:hypothetical protein